MGDSQLKASGLPPGRNLSREQTGRMVMRPLAFMEALRKEFGDIFTVDMPDGPAWVMVSDPEAIATVFKAPSDVLHAGEGKQFLESVVGENSILLLDEERHMGQRRLLLPPFRGSHIDRYGDSMREAVERAIATWPFGEPVAAAEWMHTITLEVILQTVFGVRNAERHASLRDALQGLNPRGRPTDFKQRMELIDGLIFVEIGDRAGEAEAGEADVLSLLLEAHHENGSPMSDVEIRDELMSLLVAGHETTAASLAWGLELLARHPQVQARIEEERLAGHERGGPYLDAAIRETLRIRPVSPVIIRAVKAPFELEGWTIPAGAAIVPAILLLHHRPDLYPEPAAFRPERFLDGPPDPHTWIPFGGGIRRCIGARFAMHEMGVVLSTILERAIVHGPDAEPEEMRFRNVTLIPSRGGTVVLERR